MGYTLSKPYLLKIFDIKVQDKLTFADDQGLYRLMLKPSSEVHELLVNLTSVEVSGLIKAKVEAIVVGLLQAQVKAKKLWGSAKGLCQPILAERIAKYAIAVNEDGRDYFESLQFALEKTVAVVGCRTHDVVHLQKTIGYLDELSENADRCGGAGVILEFLVGAASQFYAEAASVLAERKGEIVNAELNQEFLAKATLLCKSDCYSLESIAEHLDGVAAFITATGEVAKRAKSNSPFSTSQLKRLTQLNTNVCAHTAVRIKTFLSDQVETAFNWSVEALQNDG